MPTEEEDRKEHDDEVDDEWCANPDDVDDGVDHPMSLTGEDNEDSKEQGNERKRRDGGQEAVLEEVLRSDDDKEGPRRKSRSKGNA